LELLNGLFRSGNAFQNGDPLIECLKRFHVHKVCGRPAVLSDEDGLVILLQVSDYLCGLRFRVVTSSVLM
jgi:hypothetical protein